MTELVIDLQGQKNEPNTTIFHSYIMTAKINQTRNRVISSPRDEKCITALRKEDESRKSKRRKIQANYFEISRISTVFN